MKKTTIVKQEDEHKNINPTPPHLHVIVLPFPLQGHINPALQFSKLLISKGLKVTFVIYLSDHNNKIELTQGQLDSVTLRFLSSDEPTVIQDLRSDGGLAFLEKFKRTVKKKLPGVVSEMREAGSPVVCLIYDSVVPLALSIAKELNILGAAFFTMPCAVDTIFYNYYLGKIKVRRRMDDDNISKKDKVHVEGMEELVLEIQDLPSFLHDDADDNTTPSLALLSDQFTNVADADWVFCNTFTSLEEKILEWMGSKLKFKTVGPTIPSIYLGEQHQNDEDHHEYGLSLFQPPSRTCLLDWLDSQLPQSVVYVSFGSVATLSDKQTAEVAAALQNIRRPFIWVVRKSEQDNLPTGFISDTSNSGLVVSWCCQLEVLAHNSTGCFVTHCGWNSTIEALSLGVPMVGVPQFADQPTNAKFVEDVWKVGVRLKKLDDGIMRKEAIEKGIMEVMEGDRTKFFRRNAEKWKILARAAVAEGGTSANNIQEFVAQLTNSQLLQGTRQSGV
ncbi:UDP-glycosyltransferase 74E2 [Linum grandiflorum]